MDFLTYEGQSSEYQSSLIESTFKYEAEISQCILGKAGDVYKDAYEYLECASVHDAADFAEQYGFISKLSKYATVLEGATITAETYLSNHKSVSVDSNGNVTVDKNFIGEAIITVTAEETENYYSASTTVTITANKPQNTITASNKTLTVKTTGTQTVNLSAKFFRIENHTILCNFPLPML